MRREPTLSHVQRLMRARVCANCPYRTPGTDSQPSDVARLCESSCPLFIHLPVLREAAKHLDPMVGHRPQVLQRIIRNIGKRPGTANSVARRHETHAIGLLEDLFG